MKRDKARDDRFLDCSADYELNYVAGLYDQSEKVKTFLKNGHTNGLIKYKTHREVYALIKKELGFAEPN